MNEILFFGVIFGGIFSLFSSLVLVHMGLLIDRFPDGNEQARERSIWSPREFTRYAVMIYWPMYIAGAAMLVPGTRVLTVAGIATLFGLILFMITALVFSGATYNLMRAQRKGSGSPLVIGSVMKPQSILRAFRLPVQSRKTPSTRSSQVSRPAPIEE
ncbi:MAG TPA: hypothetical protein PK069_07055 [Methanolinea sp.]|nr:hypothetical protein [Methanolinea sp.]HQK56148.1 hypothetical protein [Methanolinea sp.]